MSYDIKGVTPRLSELMFNQCSNFAYYHYKEQNLKSLEKKAKRCDFQVYSIIYLMLIWKGRCTLMNNSIELA